MLLLVADCENVLDPTCKVGVPLGFSVSGGYLVDLAHEVWIRHCNVVGRDAHDRTWRIGISPASQLYSLCRALRHVVVCFLPNVSNTDLLTVLIEQVIDIEDLSAREDS